MEIKFKKLKDWFEISAAYDFQEGNEYMIYNFIFGFSLHYFTEGLFFIGTLIILIGYFTIRLYRDYGFRKWKGLMGKAEKYHLIKEGLLITDFSLIKEKGKMDYTASGNGIQIRE